MRFVHLLPFLAACGAELDTPREANPDGLMQTLGQTAWQFECASNPGTGNTSGSPAIAQGGASSLHRVTLDTVAYPQAICNDGTAASIYVETVSGSEDWVVHLQGGGSCQNYEDCLDRWCDQYDTTASATDRQPTMTGAFTDDEINLAGILSSHNNNAFKNYNRVFVPYCSSDYWMGDATVTWEDPNGQMDMDVEYRGKEILRAVAYTLAGGQWVSDDGLESAPAKLATADHIILSGTSAGAAGVVEEVDRFRELIQTISGTNASFHAVVDALYTSELPNGSAESELLFGLWEFSGEIGAELDETCVDDIGYTKACLSLDLLMGSSGYVETPTYFMVNRCDSILRGNIADVFASVGAPFGQPEADLIGDERRSGLLALAAVNPDLGFQLRTGSPDHVMVTKSNFLNGHDTNLMNWVNGSTVTLPGVAGFTCP